MPQDYNDSSASYKQKFLAQGRNNDSAALTGNEQQDRDNLLYFIENNFQTNVKGGITAENLRAFLHVLVKSVRTQKDDKSYVIVGNRGSRIPTGDAGRYYYGSSTSGYTIMSSYTTNLANIPSQNSFNSFRAPFELYGVSCRGTIHNTSATGDVTIKMYYSDQDDGTNVYLQNLTLIGTTTVDCAVIDTSYNFDISTTVKVPEGKLIWLLIENTGHSGSGTETLLFQASIYATRHSNNWTSS